MDVTIVIPTKNAGTQFEKVLAAIFTQKTKYQYEVICVDSGSSDNTLEIINSFPCLLFRIPSQEFGHGKTRNYGASKGTGKYIVFITQDAMPVDESWLENFIDAMENNPDAAGGFGIHYPYPDCNEMDKRDLKRHFQNFGNETRVFYIDDESRYHSDKGYQQFLAFFSDNNSCLRRTVWEKIPYDNVNFSEDQIWARKVLEAGYGKLYCPTAGVYHSHNYELKTYFQRYYDEFKGLYNVYQWKMVNTKREKWHYIIATDIKDAKYIIKKENNVPRKLYWIYYAFRRNRYRAKAGYLAGKYYSYPEIIREYLDTHISQQFKQINDQGKIMRKKKNWKELIKWIFLNPEIYAKNQRMSLKEINSDLEKKIDNRMDICGTYQFVVDDGERIPFSKEDYEGGKNEKTTINWVIPEPGIGSGGHINIFRFVSRLEKLGFHNKVYLMYPGHFRTDDSCVQFLEKYYDLDCSSIEVHINLYEMKYAHATVATSWQTAYAVRKFDNTISKFYFVQDFEPLFFPVGSEYIFAENTYKFGFRGITAGDWLKEKLRNEYGMKTDSFLFSYDQSIYVKGSKKDNKRRIFFYARPYTARRSFEFGLLVLNEVTKRLPDVEVVFAGEDISKYKIDFNHVNSGIVAIKDLSELYAQCDMCLVLSNTNLSLLPLEVMASNSVPVCTKGANSEWLVNDENSIMVEFDVNDVIEKVVYYFEHEEELAKKREKGLKFALTTSWDKEAEKVKVAFEKGIKEDEESISSRW